MVRISDRGEYNDCIEASSKLDMIQAMIETIDGCEALSDDDYNRCIDAQDLLYEVSKTVSDKAKSYIEEG